MHQSQQVDFPNVPIPTMETAPEGVYPGPRPRGLGIIHGKDQIISRDCRIWEIDVVGIHHLGWYHSGKDAVPTKGTKSKRIVK